MVAERTRTGKGGILSSHLDGICRGGKINDGQEALPHHKV